MKTAVSFAVIATAALLVSACASDANSRFVGFAKCSKDGSPVWREYPNAQGSYEGLDNREEYCGTGRR